jgi:hypothetical protein
MHSQNQLTEQQVHTFNRKQETFFAFEEAFLKRFLLLNDVHKCRKSHELYSTMGCLQDIILKTLVIDNDWQQVKYFCYTLGKVIEADHDGKKDNLHEVLVATVDSHLMASYLLWSNHRELIQRFTTFNYAQYGNTEKEIWNRWMRVEQGVGIYAYVMYHLASGMFEQVHKCIAVANRLATSRKFSRRHFPIHVRIWEAIMNNDKEAIKANILLLINKAHVFFHEELYGEGDYISSPAIGYLKAAWLLGIEVEVEHPLIPMEMMPVKPLEKYENRYWFLLD